MAIVTRRGVVIGPGGKGLGAPGGVVIGTGAPAWTPADLFAGGAPGFWPGGFDPATGRMWQLTTGETATTASAQPVGLLLDWSRKDDLGAELVVNGGFASSANWGTDAGWTISGGQAGFVQSGSGNRNLYQTGSNPIVATRAYRWAFDVVSGSGYRPFLGGLRVGPNSPTGSGVYTGVAVATASGGVLINGNMATTGAVDNFSVREFAGRPAYQATALSRPTLTLSGSRWHLYDDGNDTLNVTLANGTYSRAWVDHLGAITVERGIAISAAENVMRAARICDVLYVQGSLSAGDEASLRAYWSARYPA